MKNSESFISVKEAIDFVLNAAESFGTESIEFNKSLGRVLKETVKADREMPPFDRVSMDGIAINFEAFQTGLRSYPIEAIQAAGSEQLSLEHKEHCLEAMTGAMLPQGTDTIIPYELINIENGIAHVQVEEIKHFQNIHKKGLDRKKDAVLISKDTIITAAEIGVLATVGKTTIEVAKLPKIAIVSTGDELVDVSEIPAAYQIRKSNVHTLAAALRGFELNPDLFHITDDKNKLREKIKSLLENYDVLMFSGAVSKGKFDYLPEILQELAVQKLFHKVKQRPGKPFWFGKKEQTTIFAFPGNPVSTFVSCLKYFIPWLLKSLELGPEKKDFAVLAEDFYFKPELTYFLQVKIKNEAGVLSAFPIAGNGSGDLANLTQNDAFMELPSDRTDFKKGEAFPIIKYR
ncbi:molybdopterin molybdotransferase MoeA [Lutimonas halocynthiae]|uniref:molybdopterin molybdotransferase MoeA n=1 Tax=Lutimonas halocynthiae TaxID=1446477 RepID=UPI0025B2DC92|nr:molybdopterin molybdotransferase MoeA [Lutimonas halocynthiae]MDN3641268.1 molybdopterin molybdotransferase MoeA [Lutimonas halocynthiae]